MHTVSFPINIFHEYKYVIWHLYLQFQKSPVIRDYQIWLLSQFSTFQSLWAILAAMSSDLPPLHSISQDRPLLASVEACCCQGQTSDFPKLKMPAPATVRYALSPLSWIFWSMHLPEIPEASSHQGPPVCITKGLLPPRIISYLNSPVTDSSAFIPVSLLLVVTTPLTNTKYLVHQGPQAQPVDPEHSSLRDYQVF